MAQLKDVLARIVRELEDEEAKDEVRELREQLAAGNKVSLADIREAISSASPEERASIRELLAEELNGKEPPADGGKQEPPKRKRKEDPTPPPTGRRTRPGRKSGAAYDWYVDDDGKVVRSPTAVIYSGEDEPDEVEMLPEPDDDDGNNDEGGESK